MVPNAKLGRRQLSPKGSDFPIYTISIYTRQRQNGESEVEYSEGTGRRAVVTGRDTKKLCRFEEERNPGNENDKSDDLINGLPSSKFQYNVSRI